MEKALKGVYYYDDNFYYKIDQSNKSVLLNKKGHLKHCLIIDVTKDVVYKGRDRFVNQFEEYEEIDDETLVNNVLTSIKFKVYKKIKLRVKQ